MLCPLHFPVFRLLSLLCKYSCWAASAARISSSSSWIFRFSTDLWTCRPLCCARPSLERWLQHCWSVLPLSLELRRPARLRTPCRQRRAAPGLCNCATFRPPSIGVATSSVVVGFQDLPRLVACSSPCFRQQASSTGCSSLMTTPARQLALGSLCTNALWSSALPELPMLPAHCARCSSFQDCILLAFQAKLRFEQPSFCQAAGPSAQNPLPQSAVAAVGSGM